MTSLPLTNGIPNSILVLDGYGNVSKKPTFNIVELAYMPSFVTCSDEPVAQPMWSNGINKIYVDCPQIKVGIGTMNPSHSLHTVGDVLFNSTLHTQGEVLFGSTLRVNGPVGLGTAPSTFSRFKINGTNYGAALEIVQENTGNNSKLLLLTFTNPTTEIIKAVNTQTNHIPFMLEGNGKMTIHNGTKKIFQLESDGLLRARRIKVDAASWADFVFDDDYELMPLSEVKTFISLNNHLPNVPSESEVKENGIDLLEMNKILLQKVEELTLYLIEQNNQIDSLNKKVEILEKIQN